jgi:hypothetical protein
VRALRLAAESQCRSARARAGQHCERGGFVLRDRPTASALQEFSQFNASICRGTHSVPLYASGMQRRCKGHGAQWVYR